MMVLCNSFLCFLLSLVYFGNQCNAGTYAPVLPRDAQVLPFSSTGIIAKNEGGVVVPFCTGWVTTLGVMHTNAHCFFNDHKIALKYVMRNSLKHINAILKSGGNKRYIRQYARHWEKLLIGQHGILVWEEEKGVRSEEKSPYIQSTGSTDAIYIPSDRWMELLDRKHAENARDIKWGEAEPIGFSFQRIFIPHGWFRLEEYIQRLVNEIQEDKEKLPISLIQLLFYEDQILDGLLCSLTEAPEKVNHRIAFDLAIVTLQNPKLLAQNKAFRLQVFDHKLSSETFGSNGYPARYNGKLVVDAEVKRNPRGPKVKAPVFFVDIPVTKRTETAEAKGKSITTIANKGASGSPVYLHSGGEQYVVPMIYRGSVPADSLECKGPKPPEVKKEKAESKTVDVKEAEWKLSEDVSTATMFNGALLEFIKDVYVIASDGSVPLKDVIVPAVEFPSPDKAKENSRYAEWSAPITVTDGAKIQYENRYDQSLFEEAFEIAVLDLAKAKKKLHKDKDRIDGHRYGSRLRKKHYNIGKRRLYYE